MALTAQLALVVPALPDADFWFINAASWSNYWQGIQMTANFAAAANAKYVPSPFDPTTDIDNFNVDGVDYFVPSLARFASLQAQVAALDAAFQDMRTAMKTAGYIQESQ